MKTRLVQIINRYLARWDAVLVRKSSYEGYLAALPMLPNVYGPEVPWERAVQLCLRDVLTAGQCALDIGANVGGLAIAMSRMVGPVGEIHAFEANPRLAEQLPWEFAANGARNIRVVPKAAWVRSGEELTLHVDNGHFAGASSLINRPVSCHDVQVETVSLDDYCRHTGCAPQAIKIDVEGAEIQVFRGGWQTLQAFKPAIVMEYCPAALPEEDTAEFLQSLGYVLVDTNLYTPVSRAFYLGAFEPPPMVNVFAIHKDSGLLPPLGPPYDVQTIAKVPARGRKSAVIKLPAGRYVAALEYEAPDDAEIVLTVHAPRGRTMIYALGAARDLKPHSASHLVFELPEATSVWCTVKGRGRAAARLWEIEIKRIQCRLVRPTPTGPGEARSPLEPHFQAEGPGAASSAVAGRPAWNSR